MATKEKATAKRKQRTKIEAPRKRPRSENKTNSDDDETSIQDRILLLEGQILASKKHYNNIVELLDIARGAQEDKDAGDDEPENDDEQEPAMVAAVALCRVFMRLLAASSLALNRSMSDKEVVVVRWLRERLAEYEELLLAFVGGESGDAASTALTLAMRLLQAEGQYRRKSEKAADGETYQFPQVLLNGAVRGLVLSSAKLGQEQSEGLMDEFVEKYASEHCDVQFYTFKAVTAVLGDIIKEGNEGKVEGNASAIALIAAEGACYLLSLLDDVPATSDELETFFVTPPPQKRSHALYSVAKHRRVAQDAWLAVLQQAAGSKELRKRVLGITATVVAPWFAQPELLLDFLTDCYNAGGSTSLLALSGLYYLIRERNVDYPAFYAKLYSLLDAELLHSKHRARFFRLMDTFLSSTHLPAQLVASFIKRLARLCLQAPPSAIVTVVPWIYNVLKAHPLCTFMIHRVPRSQAERDALADGVTDPFRAEEADPMETQAIDSCLWEVVQLQTHYHPNVATIAKIISEQFTKQSYNIEDFLDHSYQSVGSFTSILFLYNFTQTNVPQMLEAEIGKGVRKAPVVEFHIPKHIFLPHDAAGETEDKLLVKLWDFA